MVESLQEGATARQPLRIGLTQAIPKLLVARLLEPALAGGPAHVICTEDRLSRLLARLVTHDLDVLISDAPVGPDADINACCHLLGRSPVSFFATPSLANELRRDFPRSLAHAPLLLPLHSVLRRDLEQWFAAERLSPQIVGEFDDSALIQVFGQSGMGAFAGPSVIEDEIMRQSRVQVFGRCDAVHESFYAISVDRRISHPGVSAIVRSGRGDMC
jgi:LysR family transcriptional activator of nhaA